MKHYSANLEQSVTVDNGDLTITAEDSLIIAAPTGELTAADGTRAIQITNGTASQYILGTGQLATNSSITTGGISTLSAGNIVTFTGVDMSEHMLDLNALAGAATNPGDRRIPVKTTSSGENVFVDGPLLADAATTTANLSAGGTLSTAGAITAVSGDITTGAGNIASAGTITAGTNLSVLGNTILGNETTDTVTVGFGVSTGQGVVLSSPTGVLSKATTIPEALLPNIAIGDVFTFSTATTSKSAAEAEFYIADTHTPDQPFHRGDIAVITYDTGNTPMTAVLIYVGVPQADRVPPAVYPDSNAASWHDISISATGIMDITAGAFLSSTMGTTPTLSADVAAVTDGATTTLTTGDAVHDFVVARQVQLAGDVTSMVTNLSSTGVAMITADIAANTVGGLELNAGSETNGFVLTTDGANGLSWTANGSVGKLSGVFTNSTSSAIDLTTLVGSPHNATVQVYEVTSNLVGTTTTRTASQIIPDSIVITDTEDTSTTPSTTAASVVITVGLNAPSGTEYRYVITG